MLTEILIPLTVTSAPFDFSEVKNSFDPSAVPVPVFVLLLIILYVAALNIFISFVAAIVESRKEIQYLPPDSHLMLSFFGGTAQHFRQEIARNYLKKVTDKTFSPVSFSALAFRCGNWEVKSRLLRFFLSILYLPLAVMGVAEMLVRWIAGLALYAVVNAAFWLVLAVIELLYRLLALLVLNIDNLFQPMQYCPDDYQRFRVPLLECPNCHQLHENLQPGEAGLFWAQCACKKFIPTTVLSGRKKLNAYCPRCKTRLGGASIKAMNVLLIGTNCSGKTAYIAALQHIFRKLTASADKYGEDSHLLVLPQELSKKMDNMYDSGFPMGYPYSVQSLQMIYRDRSLCQHGAVIYDVADETILTNTYGHAPLLFGFCHAIIIVIDPLSLPALEEELQPYIENPMDYGNREEDTANHLINNFINIYSDITGRPIEKAETRVPVAVLISKADLPLINDKLNRSAFEKEFVMHPELYNSVEEAKDSLCHKFLAECGVGNAINNLESAFSNVSYFPVSAIGHTPKHGTPFTPFNVWESFQWLAEQCRYTPILKITETRKGGRRG